MSPARAPVTAVTAAEAKPLGLPTGFRSVRLGMSRAETQKALASDPLYSYRGPEDVSLLPSPNESLIETSGLSFVRRAFFQFKDGTLWVMILLLAADKVDHYGVYTSLVEKYGEPQSLDPRESRWEDGATRIALERPLTLRYLDLAVLESLTEGGQAAASIGELELAEFLGGL